MLTSTFTPNKTYKQLTLVLLVVGVLTLIVGGALLATSDDTADRTRFWAVLLQNSIYFLMIANAAMFLICSVSLAMGGWMVVLRRVPEAISALVPVYAVIVFIILAGIVFGGQSAIYPWLDEAHVAHDKVLTWKAPFLNTSFFMITTVLTLLLWWLLGAQMRRLTRHTYERVQAAGAKIEDARKYIFKKTVWAGLFMFVFTLTMASSIPWLWLLSIDTHWYSSLYTWYVLASVLCAAVALIVIYVIYLQSQGALPLVKASHLHDLGKLLFGFSVFWAYFWYSQYMLIWYANVAEETTYFKARQDTAYAWLFYFNIFINFALPFLLLMARDTKRRANYLVLTSILVLVGHWLDFYQMVMPGPLGEVAAYRISWFELGTLCFFVGIMLFFVGRYLSTRSLIAWGDPYFKESVVHHI